MTSSNMAKETDLPSVPAAKDYYFDINWFETRQITDRVLAIREPNHFEDVLSFYVQCGNDKYLIDTGMGLADITTVFPSSEEPHVLLTHTHWDHVGSVSEFQKVAVFNHPFETKRLRSGWLPQEMIGFTPENFNQAWSIPTSFSKDTFSLPGITNFRTLYDGQVLSIGDAMIRVIHTPGHSPGSVCFFDETHGYLFTGDTLYSGPIYLHMPESDADKYFASLEKLYTITKGKIKTIFPGHNQFAISPNTLLNFLLASKGDLEPLETIEGKEV